MRTDSSEPAIEALRTRRLRLAAIPLVMGLALITFPLLATGPYTRRGMTFEETPLELVALALGVVFLIIGALLVTRVARSTPCLVVRATATHLEFPWALRSRKVTREDVARVRIVSRRRDVPEHLKVDGLGLTRHDLTAVTLFGLLRLAPVVVVETRRSPAVIPRLYDEDPEQVADAIARWADVPLVS